MDLDVALTPGQARAVDVAVVVDALRATSTAAQALAAGYRRILCAADLSTAIGLRAAGRVLAGERRCRRPDGFDQGNSPAEAAVRRGEELVLATTNGAPTIVAAAGRCPRVLLGSLLNLDAVADWLRRAAAGGATPEVQIICAGIEGRFALEDVYVAGRLSALLDATRSDAVLVAEGLARSFRTPLEALESGGGAAMLRAAGMERDVALCARESVLDTVPVVTGVRRGVAIIADGARRPVLGVTVEGRNPSMAVAR
ncbi:MAG: 2-phosphosulfolactate phosphatase [Solirubrobacteraceae bacterium]